MRTDRTLFDRIGVSCIGGNGAFLHAFSDFFEECGAAFEFPMLEIPAFCQWVTGHEPVYSIHAYKELFTQEAMFVRYYLEKLWKYMNDIGGKLAVFHAESSVPPSMICPQWFDGEALVGFENTSDAVFQYAEAFGREARFGIVLDTAHAARLGIPIEEYLHYRILHVHVRGWDQKCGYRRIKPHDPYITDVLRKILQSGYEGMFIMEYPYHSLTEWTEDRDILKKILEGILLT